MANIRKICCECFRCIGKIPTIRRVLIWRFYYFAFLYLVILCVILPLATFQNRFSGFYITKNQKLQTENEKKENDHRVARATWQLNEDRAAESTKLDSNWWHYKKKHEVIITVISTRRNNIDSRYDPKYLTQTVTELVSLLQKFQHDSSDPGYFGLALCNVDPDPQLYTELIEIADVYKINVFTRFSSSKPSDEELNNRHLKEGTDYIYCLNKSLKANPQYVLLVEDDAFPISNTLWVIKNTVLKLKSIFAKNPTEKLGFVKFYHPYRFLERAEYSYLFGFCTFFGTIATLVHHWVSRDRVLLYVYFNWFFYTLLTFLIGVLLGYANLLEMRHLSTHLYSILPTRDCCTPAVMFSKSSGDLFAKYFDKHPCQSDICPKDLVLRPFLTATRSQGLMVLPNIFEHIGLYSVVTNSVKDPSVVN